MLMSSREAFYLYSLLCHPDDYTTAQALILYLADTLWLLLLGLDPASLAQSLRGSAQVLGYIIKSR